MDICSKIDFDGNVLERSGKYIPTKILKDLKFFLDNGAMKNNIINMWNQKI